MNALINVKLPHLWFWTINLRENLNDLAKSSARNSYKGDNFAKRSRKECTDSNWCFPWKHVKRLKGELTSLGLVISLVNLNCV